MKQIPDGSVDMVMTDPPYGTTACKWDSIVPLEPMWEQLKRVIKPNGAIVMTASQPFTTTLISSNMKMFKYCWVWESNKAANFAQAPYMPLKKTEDVVVFSFATIAKNSKNRMIYNPQGLVDCDRICRGKGNSEHRPSNVTQKPYKQTKTGYPSQVLRFNKPHIACHPTQKPVALMEYLIKTYTNEGETVLDFTMGSGTTGVACVNQNRQFIGIEKDDKYYEIAKKRIKEAEDACGLFK
jgi:site-specific DNA-methyltransferase (adenine-specific)